MSHPKLTAEQVVREHGKIIERAQFLQLKIAKLEFTASDRPAEQEQAVTAVAMLYAALASCFLLGLPLSSLVQLVGGCYELWDDGVKEQLLEQLQQRAQFVAGRTPDRVM